MTRELPEGWEWTTVGAVADTQLGKTLSTKPVDGGRLKPYLRNKNVQWFRVDVDDLKETHFTGEEEIKYQLKLGDLLVCEGGEVGRCAVWQRKADELHFQNALHRVRAFDGVRPEWLQFALRWSADTGRLASHTSGVTISHLVQRALRKVELPLPPTNEQERIIAAIEEHFSRLDAVDSALDEAEKRCQALVKSILLTAIPSDMPRDWQLSEVADAGATGLGRQRSPKYHSGPNMKPYLRVANVFEDRIDTSDVMEMHFDEDDFERYRLRPGDVLLNEGQSPEWLGRPAIYKGDPPEVAFTNSLIRFIPGEEVTAEWALLVFRRHMHAGRFMKESRITTNIAHLALGRFRTVEFPIPPKEVQNELVSSTREALDAVDRQVSQIQRSRAKSQMMRQSVLSAAFSGQLVPQDTNDEPAADLLDRIALTLQST